MKRTNVVPDGEMLKEATQVLGQKTYSATINFALKEALRMQKVRSVAQFFGTGLWDGNLSEVRDPRHLGMD